VELYDYRIDETEDYHWPETPSPVKPILTRKLSEKEQLESDLRFMRGLAYGVACDQGTRSKMEDEHTIIKEFDVLNKSTHAGIGYQSFCAVYDGHHGNEAALYCRDNLHLNIASSLQQTGDISAAIKLGCAKTDADFVNLAKAKNIESGAVLAICILSGKQLYIANAGDCRAVLCRAGHAVDLTRDHTAEVYEERIRVESVGGQIEYGMLNGELKVSRAVGDIDLCTGDKMKGLTAEPDTHKLYITDDDEFVLIACDGLWDVFPSQKAISYARRLLQVDNDVQKACNDLVAEALRLESEDNITAMIIGFAKTGGKVKRRGRKEGRRRKTERERERDEKEWSEKE